MYALLALIFAADPAPGASPGADHAAEPANPILPETNEIIWGFLSFVILFVLMWRLAFPAIRKAMEAREERIRESLESAEEAKGEADRLLDDYRQKLAEARTEANTIIEEARRTAESMRRDLLARAETEREEMIQRARQEIEASQATAVEAVRREAATFSVELAERIVRQTIDRDAQGRLIEEYIAELERMGRATS